MGVCHTTTGARNHRGRFSIAETFTHCQGSCLALTRQNSTYEVASVVEPVFPTVFKRKVLEELMSETP